MSWSTDTRGCAMTKRSAAGRKYVEICTLLELMACASLHGLSAQAWIDLAERKAKKGSGQLRAAFIDAIGPNWSKARSLGHFAKGIADKSFDGFMLRRKFNNGDSSYEFGIAHADRDAWLAKAEAKERKAAELAATSKKVATLIRAGKTPEQVAAALAPVPNPPASKPTEQPAGHFSPMNHADRSHRDALAATAERGYLPGPVVPVVPIEPVQATPQEDRSGWPPSWQKNGKPDYKTPTRVDRVKGWMSNFWSAAYDAARGDMHPADVKRPKRWDPLA